MRSPMKKKRRGNTTSWHMYMHSVLSRLQQQESSSLYPPSHLPGIIFDMLSLSRPVLERHHVMSPSQFRHLSIHNPHCNSVHTYQCSNADLIFLRQALTFLISKISIVISRFTDFARQYKDMPTLGFTHYQPAQLTTVGKRATLWIQVHSLYTPHIYGRCMLIRLRIGTPLGSTEPQTGTR